MSVHVAACAGHLGTGVASCLEHIELKPAEALQQTAVLAQDH